MSFLEEVPMFFFWGGEGFFLLHLGLPLQEDTHPPLPPLPQGRFYSPAGEAVGVPFGMHEDVPRVNQDVLFRALIREQVMVTQDDSVAVP